MGNMVESSDKVADETTTKKQPTALQRAAAAVDHAIAAGTAKVATWVSTKPWTTIALALFISALCTLGFMNIKSEDQPDKLFVPDNSRAFRDRRWVESRFPNDASVSTMILDHKNGRNLLDKEALLEVFDVYDRVLATSSDGGNRGYDQRSCAVNTRNPAQPCFDAASVIASTASRHAINARVTTHRPEVRHLGVLGLGPRDVRSRYGYHSDDQPRRRARLLQWCWTFRRARPERREGFKG